ncbi:hypothetical protein K2173_013290 [Erythroxylum novogranatense]|uniref:DUF4378 domain-containing protein n=1 Tax=Erythroxylum novogranatense TaxID=1862640 RepID=A0AAV8S9Z7_9ROSI|nr:hypothetical protein K2173_013290 [Erythroxylum novogranatense]
MAKTSHKPTVRYGRDQSSCMWGFINMFDFRHSRSTQKLLTDKGPGHRHAVGVESCKNKNEMLTDPKTSCPGTPDVEETITAAADTGKPSVKTLIEEEMFSEQDTKKGISNDQVEPKQCNTEQEGHKRMNRKRRTRSRTKSCDVGIETVDVDEKTQCEQPCLQNLVNPSEYGLHIDEIMEEFCNQIHEKSGSYGKHGHRSKVHRRLNQKNPDFEEKLIEAIKRLVNQKLSNEKHATEEEDINPSKELRDVLQILSSDEMFLKLLEGPKSVILKYVQNLCDAQAEKDKGPQGRSSGKPDRIVHGKQHKFFRRRTKSLEKIPSEGNNSLRTPNTIVILKPGPTGLQTSESESDASSLPKSHLIIRNKEANERAGSYFSLTEIKRKLKNAMGKERPQTSSADTLKHSNESSAIRNCERGAKDIVGINSTSKDHFFVEKISRTPTAPRKEKKTHKLKECETSAVHDAPDNKQRASSIYLEAKKHLSELLSNGAGNAEISSRQASRTLGKILSLPDYSTTTMSNPGRDFRQNNGMIQTELSSGDQFRGQENNSSHSGLVIPSSEIHSSVSDIIISKVETPTDATPTDSNKILEIEVESIICSGGNQIISEGHVVEVADVVSQKENNIMDTPENDSSFSTVDDETGDLSEVSKETEWHESMQHVDSCEENQFPFPPLLSPTSTPVTKQVWDLKHAAEVSDRPSPVSVLEPILFEEDISPAGVRSQAVELHMQPQRIQFEEDESLATDQGMSLKTCVADEESIFNYVSEVLQVSGIKWDEFYIRSHTSDRFLDPSIFTEVQCFPNQLCLDKKLLFDCINEVLVEVYARYLGCFPGLLLLKPTIRPVPDMKNAIREIFEGVNWHLRPFPPHHTLDQIVNKDMAKIGSWMDLQFDTEAIIVEIVEAIYEDLTEEILCSCSNQSWESVGSDIPAESMENESASIL